MRIAFIWTLLIGAAASTTLAVESTTTPTTAPIARQPGDVMDLEVIDATTRKPIAGLAIVTGGIPDVFKGTTRADGHCEVPLPFQQFQNYFAVTLRGKGYASQRLVWGRNSKPEDVPDHFLVEMDRAVPVHGIVLDDGGKPVAGARVSVNFRQRFKDPHEMLDIGGSANIVSVTTGLDGRWVYNGAPPKCDRIRVAVSKNSADAPPNAAAMQDFTPVENLYDGSASLTIGHMEESKPAATQP